MFHLSYHSNVKPSNHQIYNLMSSITNLYNKYKSFLQNQTIDLVMKFYSFGFSQVNNSTWWLRIYLFKVIHWTQKTKFYYKDSIANFKNTIIGSPDLKEHPGFSFANYWNRKTKLLQLFHKSDILSVFVSKINNFVLV